MHSTLRRAANWKWVLAILAVLPLLTACPTTTPIADPPVIVSFTADDDTIDLGGGTTLRWDVTGADGIAISDGTDDLPLAPGATSIDVDPTDTTTYTLTAANDGGTATATTQVTVNGGGPVVVSFSSDEAIVVLGSATTLRWEITGADSIAISDGTDDLPLAPGATSLDVEPTGATTYTLTATNEGGTTTATTDVVAKAPADIAGLDHEIVLGSQARLTWTSDQAEAFEVFAVAGDGNALAIGDVLAGDARAVTVPVPVATRQVLRVCAAVEGLADDCAETTLTNVVTTAADWDPYFLVGFEPDDPIPGSLRSVIADAAPDSVIGFAADVTEIALWGVDLLRPYGRWLDAHLILAKNLTISGPPARVTLRGVSGAVPGEDPGDPFTYRSRMVYVAPGATVHLDRLVITDGDFIYQGGGIRNDGDLTITRSVIAGNRAWLFGGGILNFTGGVLLVEDSLLEGNRAVTEIDEIGETYAIRGDENPDELICMARASYGGGLFNEVGATATFVDTPIRGNEATVSGGGVYNRGGDLTLIRSPVTGNLADHTVYTSDPAYPDPPDYVDLPRCTYEGPFNPTSQGGGIYQAEGATLAQDASPVTGNAIGNLFVFVGSAAAADEVAPLGPEWLDERDR